MKSHRHWVRGGAILVASAVSGSFGPPLQAQQAASGEASGFPVTVQSCGRAVSFAAPPRRALATGSNLTAMMLALGLRDRMVGYTGRAPAGVDRAGLPQLQRERLGLETVLDKELDFIFAGWGYGLRTGGEIAPQSLTEHGVALYELSESCVRLGQLLAPDFSYLFHDLASLGAIFGVEARAGALIADGRRRLDALAQKVAGRSRPRVFVFDSDIRTPFTAGGYAMPQAIIAAAGGDNIAADITASWTRMAWETVIERAPEAIIIVDYGEISAAQKIAMLRAHPALAATPAVRDNRFVVLGYDQLTPGPGNIDAAEQLAAFLHGDAKAAGVAEAAR